MSAWSEKQQMSNGLMSWFSERITNESIKNLLILLLIAFISGTLVSGLLLYFPAQHEPKELFSTSDMMTAAYAPYGSR